MPDDQARPERGKAGPVKIIDTHEQIVRDYLHELEHPSPPKVFDPAEVTDGIDDPIDKLKALAEARGRSKDRNLEDRFIEVASRWAAKNNINLEAFADIGVPAPILKRAFGPATPTGGHTRSRASIGALTAGIRAKPAGTKLTVADISHELGGSDATVRKVLDQLVTAGVVVNKGPDPNHDGRGRAPILFQRV